MLYFVQKVVILEMKLFGVIAEQVILKKILVKVILARTVQI